MLKTNKHIEVEMSSRTEKERLDQTPAKSGRAIKEDGSVVNVANQGDEAVSKLNEIATNTYESLSKIIGDGKVRYFSYVATVQQGEKIAIAIDEGFFDRFRVYEANVNVFDGGPVDCEVRILSAIGTSIDEVPTRNAKKIYDLEGTAVVSGETINVGQLVSESAASVHKNTSFYPAIGTHNAYIEYDQIGIFDENPIYIVRNNSESDAKVHVSFMYAVFE